MQSLTRDKVEYIVAMIADFAKAKGLSERQAYLYLRQHKAINLLDEHYGIVHTLPMESVIDDITTYCQRQGGTIA